MAPVRGHLPTTRVRVIGGCHGREELLGGGHAEAEADGPVAVVEVEPVVGGPEHAGGGGEHRLVAGAGNLEEDPVLALQLDFLVIQPAREVHQPIKLDELGLVELGGSASGAMRFE